MADRHQRGMEAAIERLDQVNEELECHRDEHKVIVVREIKKVERKKKKIVLKRNQHMNCNGYTHSSAADNEDESGQQTVFHTP
jgi:guanylate kinase